MECSDGPEGNSTPCTASTLVLSPTDTTSPARSPPPNAPPLLNWIEPVAPPGVPPPPPVPQGAPAEVRLPAASNLAQASVAGVVAPYVTNLVVFPWSVPGASALPPAPMIGRFAVAVPATVPQVGQESVPVPVIVPPDNGAVVATLDTPPTPPGEPGFQHPVATDQTRPLVSF